VAPPCKRGGPVSRPGPRGSTGLARL
jgi:hypothetical protein